jgi:hypothetical protein
VSLAAVRSDNGVSRPHNVLAALATGARIVATQKPPKLPDPDIGIAASPDDHYLVGETALYAVSVASILKMKSRAAAGLLDAAAVKVTSVKDLPREYYIGKDPETKKCRVVLEKPDGQTMLPINAGTYASKEEAKAARRKLAECMFYVGKDPQTKECKVVVEKPDGRTMLMVGERGYPGGEEARAARKALPECN